MNDAKSNNSLERKMNGLKFSVYQAGSRIDKSTGKETKYEKGIRLWRGNKSFKLSAIECAFLMHTFQEPELKKELTIRLKEEKRLINKFVDEMED